MRQDLGLRVNASFQPTKASTNKTKKRMTSLLARFADDRRGLSPLSMEESFGLGEKYYHDHQANLMQFQFGQNHVHIDLSNQIND